MLSGEATNTDFIVFGLNRPGLEPTIYRTGGEKATHYTTGAAVLQYIVKLIEYCSRVNKSILLGKFVSYYSKNEISSVSMDIYPM